MAQTKKDKAIQIKYKSKKISQRELDGPNWPNALLSIISSEVENSNTKSIIILLSIVLFKTRFSLLYE